MLALLIAGIILEFIFFPFQFWADGEVRFRFVMDVVNKGIIDPLRYPGTGPIFSLPLALIDRIFGGNFLLLRYNFILLVLASLAIYFLLRKLIEKRLLILFLVFLLFGSMFPFHVTQYYGEVFSVLLMTLGIICIEKNRSIIGWALMIFSVANTPATIIPLGAICLYKIFWHRKYVYFLLPLFSLLVIILDAKLRLPRTLYAFTNYLFNDVNATTVMPYSGRPGFSYPMIFGLLGETLSFGKGLLFFAPGLLFVPHVWKSLTSPVIKRIFTLWMIYLIVLILLYSKWSAWYGGWFWGPRYLLFASIPASFALAYTLMSKSGTVWQKIFALAVGAWSLWVGANGVVFGQTGLSICTANNFALEHLCWYVPEFSVLFHPVVAGFRLTTFGLGALGFNFLVWLWTIKWTIRDSNP